MLPFEALLSRANDLTLQEMLGRPAVKLIRLLAGQSMSMSLLRDALLSLKSPAEILLDPSLRQSVNDLLKPQEAEALAVTLGAPSGDPYAELAKVAVSRGSRREQDLLDFFEVELPEREEVDEPESCTMCQSIYPLFAHQRDASRRVTTKLATDPRRVLLHMPTGAGKTRTAMSVIAEHLRRREPTVVLWLAFSEELCEQAATEFGTAWNSLGDRPIDLYRFWGGRTLDPRAPKDGLVVAGLSKLFSAAKESIGFIDSLRTHVSLVVMDEAHQSVAETYNTLLDVLLASPNTALLGLTATPGRTWNEPVEDEKLSKYFARQKVTLRVDGYDNPVTYLIDEGYLARPTFRPVMYRPGTELSPADIAAIARHFDIPDTVLRKLQDDEQRNLAILRAVEDLVKRHRRVLVFAASVQHARLLASVMRSRGLDAAAVTGVTPRDERARLINQFREGSDDPKVLCNYGVLTTGFDAPKTSAAVIGRPTKSLVLFSQMVGRAIRGPKAGGNNTAEVLVVQDPQLPGFGSIAEAFTNWEDVWSHD